MNHGLLRIDAPAREYVERSAASAQKTLTGIHEAGNSLSGSLESAVLHAIETNAKVNRNFADLVYKNTQASIGLIQTLSGVNAPRGVSSLCGLSQEHERDEPRLIPRQRRIREGARHGGCHHGS